MGLSEKQQNALARATQTAFPLVRDPYSALAAKVGAGPEEIRAQLITWQEDGRLREVSAILEGSALGYESALVAAEVPEVRLLEVADIINEHPTITHNYVREHRYNLWFTLSVPSSMGLVPTLAALSTATGIPRFVLLRRTQTFKIGVNFDLITRRSQTQQQELCAPAPVRLDGRARACFRALQTPLPLTVDPFGTLGRRTGSDPDTLLAFARSHLGGAIRRYVSTFRHRRLGVGGNGMAVWAVPEADQARVGAILAAAPEVSHCYARNAVEGFPYTVYSMIHGPERRAVEEIVERLTRETGVTERIVLFSTHELKKCRLRYFLPQLSRWWAAHTPERAAA